MTRILLNARHWQLFLITFVLPLIMYGIFIFQLIMSLERNSYPDTNTYVMQGVIAIIIIIILIVTMLAWYWSLGVGLQSKIPGQFRLNTTMFKFCLLFPYAYTAAMVFYIFAISTFATPSISFQLLPFQLFAMFCMLYTLYFAAKTLKTAEVQRPVTFSDFVGEFFLLWFFPIGVWFIQPRVNRLASAEKPEDIKIPRAGFENTLD